MPENSARVALVTPWFGENATDGCQLLSSQLAYELFGPAERVDILTTCARSFDDDWSANAYAEGTVRFENFTIRRFKVRPQDKAAFNWANEFLLSQPVEWMRTHANCIPASVTSNFCAENIHSPGLLQYLADWGRRYEAIVFTPYLYGPILSGVELVAPRAYLQPCLHDEAYAYLPRVRKIFHAAKGLLFNSHAEYDLARRLYGPGIAAKSSVVGHWVNAPQSNSHDGRAASLGRYVLYLGRIDATKRVDALVRAFADYRRYQPASRLRLVLAGSGGMQLPAHSGVVALGKVSELEKSALLSSCVALMQPSANESFSRTVMEAWSYGKPVAVNATCDATAAAVRACAGGWLASSHSEWIAVLAAIEHASADALRSAGESGRQHYLCNGTPEHVLRRYRAALNLDTAPAIARVAAQA